MFLYLEHIENHNVLQAPKLRMTMVVQSGGRLFVQSQSSKLENSG